MKKAIVGVASVLASALLMAGCNKQVIDLTYEYNWAQLKMPDGTVGAHPAETAAERKKGGVRQ